MTIKRRGTTSALKRLAYAQLLAIGLSLTHAIHAAPASSAMSGFEPLIGGQWAPRQHLSNLHLGTGPTERLW